MSPHLLSSDLTQRRFRLEYIPQTLSHDDATCDHLRDFQCQSAVLFTGVSLVSGDCIFQTGWSAPGRLSDARLKIHMLHNGQYQHPHGDGLSPA
ncbi:hypothetical protein [Pluralibacter sp.]|uniref:hypothetical protein n=1 Tax=Pluralibacter sp. TaxID=1920032 RepID=UPI0025E63145|nr:hypothetical protein [Pluralibacter sp.]MBV8041895.1 hypothetical protein [Pluralibacter sp.]